MEPIVLLRATKDLVLSDNAQFCASLNNDGNEVVITDLRETDDLKVIGSWKPPIKHVERIQISPHGTWVAAWSNKSTETPGAVHLYNLQQRKPGVILEFPKSERGYSNRERTDAVLFTNNDKIIVTQNGFGIKIWKNPGATGKSAEN